MGKECQCCLTIKQFLCQILKLRVCRSLQHLTCANQSSLQDRKPLVPLKPVAAELRRAAKEVIERLKKQPSDGFDVEKATLS
jgi:hypothetical protein